ncbi:DUF6564 domain-containing protein [Lachnospiraceae bacterium 29-91]
MKIAIITAAGISSRFNEGYPEEEKKLKVIYHEAGSKETLLLHLVKNCSAFDEVIIVGGYRYEELKEYAEKEIMEATDSKITVLYNPHFSDLASGYSLYLGLYEALKRDGVTEILFVEGDLDIDKKSFDKVIKAKTSVLTYNHTPIYSNKAVVLYRTEEGRYHYIFNSSHGILKIDDAFTCILNSGQLWKFTDIEAVKKVCDDFFYTEKNGTNLLLIQNYIDQIQTEQIDVIELNQWTNCNTREDFHNIKEGWEAKR